MKNNYKDTPKIIAPPPLIYGAPLLLGLLCHYFIPLPISNVSWLSIIGWIFLISSVILVITGTRAFKRIGTNIDPYKPVLKIIEDGPFKFSRNPLYLSLTILYVGISIVINTLWPILFLPSVLFIMHHGVIKREEKYLEEKFGQKYLNYKSKVRRWL